MARSKTIYGPDAADNVPVIFQIFRDIYAEIPAEEAGQTNEHALRCLSDIFADNAKFMGTDEEQLRHGPEGAAAYLRERGAKRQKQHMQICQVLAVNDENTASYILNIIFHGVARDGAVTQKQATILVCTEMQDEKEMIVEFTSFPAAHSSQ